MKTIIAFKMLLVLCCYSESENGYKYEVKTLGENVSETGVVYTSTKYSEGDTILLPYQKTIESK